MKWTRNRSLIVNKNGCWWISLIGLWRCAQLNRVSLVAFNAKGERSWQTLGLSTRIACQSLRPCANNSLPFQISFLPPSWNDTTYLTTIQKSYSRRPSHASRRSVHLYNTKIIINNNQQRKKGCNQVEFLYCFSFFRLYSVRSSLRPGSLKEPLCSIENSRALRLSRLPWWPLLLASLQTRPPLTNRSISLH